MRNSLDTGGTTSFKICRKFGFYSTLLKLYIYIYILYNSCKNSSRHEVIKILQTHNILLFNISRPNTNWQYYTNDFQVYYFVVRKN